LEIIEDKKCNRPGTLGKKELELMVYRKNRIGIEKELKRN